MRAHVVAIAVSAFMLTVLGCHPSEESVARNVQRSMQETFNSNADYKPLKLNVEEVTVIRSHDNTYTGMATVASFASKHNLPITVTADGSHVIWQTDSGGLSVFAPDLLKAALEGTASATSDNVPREEKSNSELSPQSEARQELATNRDSDVPISSTEDMSQASVSFVQTRFRLKAEAQEIAQGSVWTGYQVASTNPNFLEFAVDFTSPDLSERCSWVVGIPKAAPDARSVSSKDACVDAHFTEK